MCEMQKFMLALLSLFFVWSCNSLTSPLLKSKKTTHLLWDTDQILGRATWMWMTNQYTLFRKFEIDKIIYQKKAHNKIWMNLFPFISTFTPRAQVRYSSQLVTVNKKKLVKKSQKTCFQLLTANRGDLVK